MSRIRVKIKLLFESRHLYLTDSNLYFYSYLAELATAHKYNI